VKSVPLYEPMAQELAPANARVIVISSRHAPHYTLFITIKVKKKNFTVPLINDSTQQISCESDLPFPFNNP